MELRATTERKTSAASGGVVRSARLVSLDALRGLTIALMLLVNNIGLEEDTPRQLTHAGWSGGLTLADFVFPWFLFCVGVAIPFSAAAFERRKLPSWRHDLRMVYRTAALLLLGCLVTSSAAGRLGFSLGVLQLIGLAYLVGATLHDLPGYRRLAIAGIVLIGYWGAIRFLPIPGIGAGYFQEGINLVHHVNRKFLAPLGLEGLPLVVPTSAVVMIGSFVGDLMRRRKIEDRRRTLMLAAFGAILMALGALWNLDMGFNKPLWTPPYVLFAIGTGCVLLAAMYYLIDLRGWRAWAFPLVVFGSNAILAYVAPILVKNLLLHQIHLSTAGLWRAFAYMVFWWLVLLALYRKRLFLKV